MRRLSTAVIHPFNLRLLMFVLIYHMHMCWRGKTDFPRKIALEAAQLGMGAGGWAHLWHSGTVSDTLQASVVV